MKKVTGKFFIAALMTSFVAASEPAKVPAAADAAPTESWLEQLNAAAVAQPKKFAHLARLRKGVPADGLSEELKRQLVNDQFFVEDAALTAYLSELVERLLTGWQGTRPAVVILVKSDNSKCTSATAEGEIIVCTGMLRELRTEKALAALLGHELSHILLQHSALTMLSNKLDMMVQGAGLTAAAATVYGDPSDKGASDALDTFAGTQAASLLWSDLLRPRHKREDEKKSDELGTDLALAAGFGSVGWDELFVVLKQDAAKLSARMSLLQEAAKAKMLVDAAKRLGDDDGDAGKELLKLGALDEAQKQAFDWLAELNVDYPPKDVREANRKNYEVAVAAGKPDPEPWMSGKFETVMGGGAGTELLQLDLATFDLEKAIQARDRKKAAEHFALLTKKPESMQPRALYVASQYAYNQKDFTAAGAFLARLTTTRYPPASAYISLASLRGKNLDNPPAAIAVLDSGIAKLRTKRPFLPLLAGMHVKVGDSKLATKYGALCGCYSNKIGLSGDAIARKLLGEQTDDLKQQCIKEMGYDVDAAPNAKQGPLSGAGAVFRNLLRRGQCLIDT